jgi:hypothetical protein
LAIKKCKTKTEKKNRKIANSYQVRPNIQVTSSGRNTTIFPRKEKKEEKVAVKRQLSQDRDNLQEWSVDEE